MTSEEQRFLDAARSAGEIGISTREMAKRNTDKPLIVWMRAGHKLNEQKHLSHSWSPVKGDPGCFQESRYFFINSDF